MVLCEVVLSMSECIPYLVSLFLYFLSWIENYLNQFTSEYFSASNVCFLCKQIWLLLSSARFIDSRRKSSWLFSTQVILRHYVDTMLIPIFGLFFVSIWDEPKLDHWIFTWQSIFRHSGSSGFDKDILSSLLVLFVFGM